MVGRLTLDQEAEVRILYPQPDHLMKVRDELILLLDDGWYLVRRRGSHRQYRHTSKSGRVTVAGHPRDDVPTGTLNNILRQASLRTERD